MTVKRTVVCFACIALVACGRGAEDAAKPATATSDAAEAPHKDDPNTVEVDEGMLRDLRITTRPVESRTGGDLVMLLGELTVGGLRFETLAQAGELGGADAERAAPQLVRAGTDAGVVAGIHGEQERVDLIRHERQEQRAHAGAAGARWVEIRLRAGEQGRQIGSRGGRRARAPGGLEREEAREQAVERPAEVATELDVDDGVDVAESAGFDQCAEATVKEARTDG